MLVSIDTIHLTHLSANEASRPSDCEPGVPEGGPCAFALKTAMCAVRIVPSRNAILNAVPVDGNPRRTLGNTSFFMAINHLVDKKKILKNLHESGMKAEAIADQLDLDIGTVKDWIKQI
jgi:hypothetical protein